MRKDGFENLLLKGRIEESRGRGKSASNLPDVFM